ncbi:amidohydrolase family protein [archaeon]|nr:amidohydrolase family protein [archaeon]
MDVLIKNGLVLTMDKRRRILKNTSIGITDGKITDIAEDLKGEADFVIDASDKIVMPGLINAHTHLPMTLLRGMADDLPLDKWLNEEIWPIEAQLEAKHVYAGALLGCLEMIQSGTTCFNDMYFFMDEVARSCKETGIRGCISHAMFDFGDTSKIPEMLGHGKDNISKYKNGLVRAFVAPHAPYTCSQELLLKAKELAEENETRLHIHIAESQKEVNDSIEQKGAPPFEYLDKIGFLDENVIAVHSVWASEKEIGIMKKRGVKVAHNPISNMKLASGVAPVPEYLKKGICVALGTDGAASNNNLSMFSEMKTCALLHKISNMDPSTVPAYSVLESATINGARALGMEEEIGSIEVGKTADIILVNLKSANMTPLTNPVSHIVYAAKGSDVNSVIVDGRILMQDRELRTLDLEDVLKFANEEARKLFLKAGKEDKLF